MCVMMQKRRRRRRKFHAFNKKITISFFLDMHFLFFTLPNFFVTLFMIIYYLSLYLFVSHLSSLFSTNLFFSLQSLFFCIFVHFFPLSTSFSLGVFSCQYYVSTHLNILCNFLFLIYSLSFSLKFYRVFFTKRVGERKQYNIVGA